MLSGCLVALRDDAPRVVTMLKQRKELSFKKKVETVCQFEEKPKRKRIDLAREFALPLSKGNFERSWKFPEAV